MTPQTSRAVVTVQYNGEGYLEAAAADLTELIARFAGGQCTVTIADHDRPVAEIG